MVKKFTPRSWLNSSMIDTYRICMQYENNQISLSELIGLICQWSSPKFLGCKGHQSQLTLSKIVARKNVCAIWKQPKQLNNYHRSQCWPWPRFQGYKVTPRKWSQQFWFCDSLCLEIYTKHVFRLLNFIGFLSTADHFKKITNIKKFDFLHFKQFWFWIYLDTPWSNQFVPSIPGFREDFSRFFLPSPITELF